MTVQCPVSGRLYPGERAHRSRFHVYVYPDCAPVVVATVLIEIRGGGVYGVGADEPVELIVIDHDVETRSVSLLTADAAKLRTAVAEARLYKEFDDGPA